MKSKIGLQASCTLIEEFEMKEGGYHAILVDEANFLTEAQVDWLAEICDNYRYTVLCYGLKTDFQGKLLKVPGVFCNLADAIEEIPTICWCGKKARFNARIRDGRIVRDGEQISLAPMICMCRFAGSIL